MPHRMLALIFDLDGTLTDSKPGIVGCLRKVLNTHQIVDPGPLDRFVGPPVQEWTHELLPHGSVEERATLVRDYRECYRREGWRNNSVFPGVHEMLSQLQSAGLPLYVCTSKHQPDAERILDFFELSCYFKAVYGDRPEYSSHGKVDLLALLLREQSLSSVETWMIGDRKFDVEAAHANDIRCLAVAWGYGMPEEYANADALAATPVDVLACFAPECAVSASCDGVRELLIDHSTICEDRSAEYALGITKRVSTYQKA